MPKLDAPSTRRSHLANQMPLVRFFRGNLPVVAATCIAITLKELLTPRQHEIASLIAKGAQPTAGDDLRQ